MYSIKHHSNNRVLGAPSEWDHDELRCNALSITDTEIGAVPMVCSFWVPTKEEMDMLMKGGYVRLWIVGRNMPPVMLTAEMPS